MGDASAGAHLTPSDHKIADVVAR